MNDLYLVRIITHQQVTLYIDRGGLVWTENDLNSQREEPTYYDDIQIVTRDAKIYGGQTVKRMMTLELVEEAAKNEQQVSIRR